MANIEIRIDGDEECGKLLDCNASDIESGSFGSDFWCDPDYCYRPDGSLLTFSNGPELEDGTQTIITLTGEYDETDSRVLLAFYADLEISGQYDALRHRDNCRFAPLPQSSETYKEVMSSGGLCWGDALAKYAERHGLYVIAYRGGCGYGYSITLIDALMLQTRAELVEYIKANSYKRGDNASKNPEDANYSRPLFSYYDDGEFTKPIEEITDEELLEAARFVRIHSRLLAGPQTPRA